MSISKSSWTFLTPTQSYDAFATEREFWEDQFEKTNHKLDVATSANRSILRTMRDMKRTQVCLPPPLSPLTMHLRLRRTQDDIRREDDQLGK